MDYAVLYQEGELFDRLQSPSRDTERECEQTDDEDLEYAAGATVEVTADFQHHTLSFSVNGHSETVPFFSVLGLKPARHACTVWCVSRYRYQLELRCVGQHASTMRARL